ncbi:sulfatase-like hydrolase/transferase [Desulfoprunum benzoelyticum]|nr:sulfatase-like hydrolase/transferase [Desulfoprunum benzoelyticum]MBM9528879.1 sulfatase-like hydrolase/transferase [Desulfoprunum benzoelyticum]
MLIFIYLLLLAGVFFTLNQNFFLIYIGCIVDVYVIYLIFKVTKNWSNKLLAVVPLVLGIIYIVQLYSVYAVGGYLSPLAIQNAQTAYTTDIKYTLLIWVLLIFALVYLVEMVRPQKQNKNTTAAIIVPLYLLSIPIAPLANNFSVNVLESPIRSFALSAYAAYFNPNKKSDINFLQIGSLRKRQVYEYRNKYINVSDKNIVVIFSEGISSRWIAPYGGIYSDLTPNLNKLYGESFVIDNYYNHTAATFRGLRGQLLSSFQRIGGSNVEKTGLMQRQDSIKSKFNWTYPVEALKDEGYKSYFYLSQENVLNKMLETLKFDEVYGRTKLSELYLDGKIDSKVLTDKQLFESMLKSLIEKNEKGEKFFAALYNFDTHNNLNAEISYRGLNNEVLNRLKKFDSIFGDFLQEFKKSRLSENTVLIFTSDHSTFPDRHARSADPRMPHFFVDKIPFLIYGNGIKHNIFDAEGATSIAFMPTLLDFLGIKNFSNMMIGCSMFEKCSANRLIVIGDERFQTSREGFVPIKNNNEFHKQHQIVDLSLNLSDFN